MGWKEDLEKQIVQAERSGNRALVRLLKAQMKGVAFPRFYRVRENQNYESIAREVYDDESMAFALIRANMSRSGIPLILRPGMTIKLVPPQVGRPFVSPGDIARGQMLDQMVGYQGTLEYAPGTQPSQYYQSLLGELGVTAPQATVGTPGSVTQAALGYTPSIRPTIPITGSARALGAEAMETGGVNIPEQPNAAQRTETRLPPRPTRAQAVVAPLRPV
ncbi:MAG: hypothetical protein AB1744_15630, partial [Candidatus Zixiibacteriota bacterium]